VPEVRLDGIGVDDGVRFVAWVDSSNWGVAFILVGWSGVRSR